MSATTSRGGRRRPGLCPPTPSTRALLVWRRHHLIHAGHVGRHELLLFPLRHLEVIERAYDLRADLLELGSREVEVLMSFVERLAGVFDGSAGLCDDPDGPHELQTRQPGGCFLFIPRPKRRVIVELRVLDDLVAEAVDDR